MSETTGSSWGHLKTILRVFRRRGAGTLEFAKFLNYLFSAGGPHALRRVGCRHNAGRQHDAMLIGESYCSTTGSLDANKAPKLVVSDIRKKARVFLDSSGYGTILDWQERLLDVWGVSDSALEVGDPDSELDDSEVVGLDHITDLERSSILDLVGYLDSDPVCSSPPRDYQGLRATTGLRAYVLTWLWAKRNDPDLLDAGIRQIKQAAESGSELFLHRCGCGLSQVNGSAHGCAEPSHLYLGPQLANSNHTSYHFTLRQLDNAGYSTVLPIMRAQCADARTIF